MENNEDIFVTKPYLPSLDRLLPGLNLIWESKKVTNQALYHQKFEEKLSNYLGEPYVSLFSNCTIALMVAIKALELKGDIITSPFSFAATVHSLTWNNINPIFVDIDPKSFNIDVNLIEKAITDNTVGILPVHAYGNSCEIEAIHCLAKKYNLKVIYDGAACLGSQYQSKSVLSFGDISVVSFHATKILNTFEGGAIICHSQELKNKIDRIKNFGLGVDDQILPFGINGKMNEFSCLLGFTQMEDFSEILLTRKEIANIYNTKLSSNSLIHLPNMLFDLNYNYTYYPILLKDEGLRNYLYNELRKQRIFVRKYYHPMLNNILNSHTRNLEYKVANDISSRILCLPIYPGLNRDTQLRIINLVLGLIQSF